MLEIVDIRECFEEVKPGLEALIRKYGDQYWTTDQVYEQCVTGEAHLFMDRLEHPGWFLVVRVISDLCTREPILFLWLAYAPHALSTDLWPEIEELARLIGAKKIRMESSRHGFVRMGWKVRNIIFEREIP